MSSTTTTSVTPRLRMTRRSPTPQDRATLTTTSLSEAGPSRLPDLSQLVNVTLKDMDISDDNMYASDVPTEPNGQPRQHIATSPSVTRADNPAAVLRALLSRLPNNDASATPTNERVGHQYPSEKDSDYDDETASATTSVAQSSLKNIFSRALREPGGTPRKGQSHRRRSSSISAAGGEETPHIVEARDIKGKRRSLSDDEVENANKSSSQPRTRVKVASQPLTQEFLSQRFGGLSPSQSMHRDDESVNEIPGLGDSQGTPPVATSTPQQSLRMSMDQSKFQSNLLEQDSDMRKAFAALDSSTDNMSDRSISPVPILQIESELLDDNDLPTKFHDDRISTIRHSSQTSSQMTRRLGAKDLSSSVRSATKSSHSKSGTYDKHDSLGEQTMSLSLPAGHGALQFNNVDYSPKLPSQSGLSRKHSFPRPSSPLPGLQRPRTPVGAIHERERNWNKPHRSRHDSSSSSHLPRPSSVLSHCSTSSHHDRDSPVDSLHERERNWDSPHPTWHESPSSRRHSRNISLSSPSKSPVQERHCSEDQLDVMHERERNWNARRPKWHDGISLQSPKDKLPMSPQKSADRARANSFHKRSHEAISANGHRDRSHSPQLKRQSSTQSMSSLSPVISPPRPSSLHIHDRSCVSTSPLPTPGKKQEALFSSSVVNRNTKSQSAMPVSKKPRVSRGAATPNSVDRSSVVLGREDASHTPPTHSKATTPEDSLKTGPSGCSSTHDIDADDLKETDFSSPSERGSPKLEAHQMFDSQELQTGQTSTPKAPINGRPLTPRMSVQDRTSVGNIADSASSPSTPPQRVTPKNANLVLKTPSPNSLPDLPTPSSSDESRHSPVRQLNTPFHSKWMKTPKPPGGWLATPKADEETVLDDASESLYPQTPTVGEPTQLHLKTPKPPGGWTSTPGPAISNPNELNIQQDEGGQRSQLLTPVSSLSRGTVSNLKTPGAPGSWTATPAARKSVLQVRFYPGSPEVQDSSHPLDASELPSESDISETRGHNEADDQESGAPPSPRSPRRPKANIRILDAFGREETHNSLSKKDVNPLRPGIRVLDSMGRELRDDESKEEPGIPPSRDELLSKLKQGLGDLAGDIDDPDSREDVLGPDRSRIQELVATSRQSRGVRQRLHSQSKNWSVVNPFIKPSFISLSWKWCFVLVLLQTVIFFVMYQISVARARNLFFNAYYDPFNPDLNLHTFKSDSTLHLPRLDLSSTSWLRTLFPNRWYTWFDVVDPSCVTQLCSMAVQRNKGWPPT